MCVIIHRQPNIDIPFDDLKSACIVNPDGMGIAVADRGKMELRRVFNAKGNDPEYLARFIEDAKAHDIYIHLRFRTKGAKDVHNVHPFTVLKQKKHGMDIQFMHNGTLSTFGNQADCDSKDFAQTLVNPLAERIMKAVGPDKVLADPVFQTIMGKYAGANSIFLLVDNFNNRLKIGDGHQFEGWWASNEYSFNRHHRTKDYSEWTGGGYSRGYYVDGQWVQVEGSSSSTTTGKAGNGVSVATTAAAAKSAASTGATTKKEKPFDDEIPFDTGDTKKEAAKEGAVGKSSSTLPKRSTFCEIANIETLYEVTTLTRTHIEEMVDEYPENAVLLIQDLLFELYQRDLAMDETEYYE